MNVEIMDVEGETCLLDNDKKGVKIQYVDQIKRPNNYKSEIDYDEIDNFDFKNNAFIELLNAPEYVHLYFDFDKINNEEELENVFEWLNNDVSKIFGKYTYSGYSNNQYLSDGYHLKYLIMGGHVVSMHVVFYETKIKAKDVVRIMHHTNKKGYSTQGVHRLCDPNVYKLIPDKEGEGKRQLMRFGLSDKIYLSKSEYERRCKENNGNKDKIVELGKEYDKNKYNHADVIVYGNNVRSENAKPSEHIITVRGNERLIDENEWSSLFKVYTEEEKDANEKNIHNININTDVNDIKKVVVNKSVNITKEVNQNRTGFTIEDLYVNTDLILLDEDELLNLFNEFDYEFDNLKEVIMNALHSPYDKDFIVGVVNKWYNQRIHHNEGTVESFSKYYENVNSNKWFFSILKHLSKEKRRWYKDKYAWRTVNEDECIEIRDKFAFYDIQKKDYKNKDGNGIKVGELLSDLKKVLVIIAKSDPIYVVKDYEDINEDSCDMREIPRLYNHSMKTFRTTAKEHIVGYYNEGNKSKKITLWDVINNPKNKKHLMKKGIKFYTKNNEYMSMFNGYDFDEKECNIKMIEPYLNHIRDIICDGKEDCYEYVLNWMSYIIQNPMGKTETAIVLLGEPGAGKNTFTNVFAELFGVYSNMNVTNIDDICGKFNTGAVNKKLLVCNELSSVELNKYLNEDALKSMITEYTMVVNEKMEKKVTMDNVCNFIFVSNDNNPLIIRDGDRRYVVLRVNSSRIGDSEYWNMLKTLVKSYEFKMELYNYLRTRDLSNVNLRKIPMTEAKKMIIEANRSSYEIFIKENYERFVEGYNKDEVQQDYRYFCPANGFKLCNSNTLRMKLLEYCDERRLGARNDRHNKYVLKKKYYDKFKDEDCDNEEDVL